MVAESRDGRPCVTVAESMDGNLVSWWQKGRVETLCHGGRK